MQDLKTLRHSTAHVLAQAVKRLYPEAKLGIGPATDEGFYYDFDNLDIKEKDLEKIEKEMEKIIKEDHPFIQEFWEREKALDFFSKNKEDYKVELIKELENQKLSIYRSGEFVDLCKGPHLDSTSQIKAFKLLKISGAYWKGKESNPQLTRIYGTAFFSKSDLEKFLKNLDESKQRDHRLLGKQLELYEIFYKEAGAGFIFWLPKGAFIRRKIEDWLIDEHLKRGYKLLYTPHLFLSNLFKTSGHLDYYRELMYVFNQENSEMVIKPMNCPAHILIYKSKIRSYKELPLRFFELGTVYRYEKSGVLHGLLRVRGFTQDDAHIFLPEDMVKEEVKEIIKFIDHTFKTFGFKDFEIELSTQPEKFIGTQSMWDKATKSLQKALEELNLKYKICPGEGAFYGPKIDVKVKDALNRLWQCSTIQVDFALPENFNLSYVDENNQKKKVVLIHRAILGSLERFFGILIEHYKGLFPVWLAPVQVRILSISDKSLKYAKELEEIFKKEKIRVELDLRNLTLSKKILEAESEKIPLICVVGEKEAENKTINLRDKIRKVKKEVKVEEFLKELKERIESKEVLF